AAAGLLPVDGALLEPDVLPLAIDARDHRAHCGAVILDESMAGEEAARRGHAEVARAGAAGIRAMSTPMNLLERRDPVRTRIRAAGNNPPLELVTALDHRVKQDVDVAVLQFTATGRRRQHG